MKITIKSEDKADFLAQLIDIFDDALEERDIRIPSSDEEMKENDEFEGNEARLYGMDYGWLQENLENAVREWPGTKSNENGLTLCVKENDVPKLASLYLTDVFSRFLQEKEIDPRKLDLSAVRSQIINVLDEWADMGKTVNEETVGVTAVISDGTDTHEIAARAVIAIGVDPDTAYIMGKNSGGDLLLASAKSAAAIVLKMACGDQAIAIKNKAAYVKAFERFIDNALAAQENEAPVPESGPDIVHWNEEP